MVALIPILILLALGYFVFNFKNLLSFLAALLFFLILIIVPALVAGNNLLLYLAVMGGIIFIVWRTVGPDIFRSRILNFAMGIALFLGLIIGMFQCCRMGW
jgi:hypothetical protein